MNILIYGNVASGKTLLAELLVKHYGEQGQPATIMNDTITTSSWRKGDKMKQGAEKLLEKTLHNPTRHTIVTTQASPGNIYRFYDTEDPYDPDAVTEALFDYYYHLLSKRSKGKFLLAR